MEKEPEKKLTEEQLINHYFSAEKVLQRMTEKLLKEEKTAPEGNNVDWSQANDLAEEINELIDKIPES